MKLMGIVNVTPDSFYDQGAFFDAEKAIELGHRLCQEGADILDIGGCSSRPFAPLVSAEEELARVAPVIEELRELPIPLSIDTDKAAVASRALELGATMINNIGGFTDPEMIEVAASCKGDLCLMHMQGTPQTMQISPNYPEGVVKEIMAFFEKQIERLEKAGIDRHRIILDPGIGFGKTLAHTLEIFQALEEFQKFGLRLLIGASRKSFLSKLLGRPSTELLPATLAIHTMAIYRGVDVIRVHDVREHRDVLDLLASVTVEK